MSKHGWTLWIIPVGLWAFFACWHCGYQSGYADGHSAVDVMFRKSIANLRVPGHQIAAAPDFEDSADRPMGE